MYMNYANYDYTYLTMYCTMMYVRIYVVCERPHIPMSPEMVYVCVVYIHIHIYMYVYFVSVPMSPCPPSRGVCMYAPISLCIFCERPHVPVSPVGVYVCIVCNYISISLCIFCERPHVPVSPVGVYVCIVHIHLYIYVYIHT